MERVARFDRPSDAKCSVTLEFDKGFATSDGGCVGSPFRVEHGYEDPHGATHEGSRGDTELSKRASLLASELA